MKRGGNLVAILTKFELKNGHDKITFDIIIKTPKGAIFCVYIKREVALSAVTKENNNQSVSEQLGHEIMGHMDKVRARESLIYLGYTIVRGTMKPCRACGEAKVKQRSLPRNVVHHSKSADEITIPRKAGEEVRLDISSIKPPKDSGITISKPYWRIVADKRTGMKYSEFYPTKNEMIEPTRKLFTKWKQEGNEVKKVRCDNGKKNIKLQSDLASVSWKLNPEFEYTARDTPQQNSRVEVGLYTIARRGMAMMIHAKIPQTLRYTNRHTHRFISYS